jgi:hypothetical protein
MRVQSNPLSTRHFALRAAERGVRDEVIDFVHAFGTEFEGANARSYTVLAKNLPRDVRALPIVEKAKGVILVTSREGALLTCYRREDAPRFLKRKAERRYGEPVAA